MAEAGDVSQTQTDDSGSANYYGSGRIQSLLEQEVVDQHGEDAFLAQKYGVHVREGSDLDRFRQSFCQGNRLRDYKVDNLTKVRCFLSSSSISSGAAEGVFLDDDTVTTSFAEKSQLDKACCCADFESIADDWQFPDDETEVQQSTSEEFFMGRQDDTSADLSFQDNMEEADILRQYLLYRGLEDPSVDLLMLQSLMMDEQSNDVATAFPLGELKTIECLVCYSLALLNLRPCCAFPVCNVCLETYFHTEVSEAIVKIPCPNPECSQMVHRDEILARLSVEMKVKFNQFLVDANKEPHRKTCPRCSTIVTVDLLLLREPVAKKYGVQVECSECSLLWCFPCQAPLHEGMKCKEYRRGDKLVKVWARERPQGQVNAQKCPKCKVFIQRSAGCDHMTCSHCNTHFCYQCGEKFREFKFIGNHYSRLSIFGCKYLYKHDKAAQRKLVRGSIFGAKLLAAPVLGGLALGAGAVMAGIGLIVLPFYGGYKLHKKLQHMKEMKRLQAQDAMRSCSFNNSRHRNMDITALNFPNIIGSERLSATEDFNIHGGLVLLPRDLFKDELDRTERRFMQSNRQNSTSDIRASTRGNRTESDRQLEFDLEATELAIPMNVEKSLTVPEDVNFVSKAGSGAGVDTNSVKVLKVPSTPVDAKPATPFAGNASEIRVLTAAHCEEIFV